MGVAYVGYRCERVSVTLTSSGSRYCIIDESGFHYSKCNVIWLGFLFWRRAGNTKRLQCHMVGVLQSPDCGVGRA